MNNFKYYVQLARMSYPDGLTPGMLANFSIYHENRTFDDVRTILREQSEMGVPENGLRLIASGLQNVLEIDTRLFDKVYGKPKVNFS